MLLQDVLYYSFADGNTILDTISLEHDKFYVFDEINKDLIKVAKEMKEGCLFIGTENIYSHNMNVLRRVSHGKHIIIVIGTEKINSNIKTCKTCELKLGENTIIIDGNDYTFQEFEISKDADERLDYNTANGAICYKPDYYYSVELADIVKTGFDRSKIMVHNNSTTYTDKLNRIWNIGIGSPFEIYAYIKMHTSEYYHLLSEYLDVLSSLLDMSSENGYSDRLRNKIIEHFSYSTLFSFVLSKIGSDLNIALNDRFLIEKCYTLFSLISPINDKYSLTIPTITKLKQLTSEFEKNNYSALKDIYNEFIGLDISDTLALFVIMNMFSDTRRCVISTLIERNTWFESICSHKRKETKVY